MNVEGFLAGSAEAKVEQNVLKFATLDGKSVDVEVWGSACALFL